MLKLTTTTTTTVVRLFIMIAATSTSTIEWPSKKLFVCEYSILHLY